MLINLLKALYDKGSAFIRKRTYLQILPPGLNLEIIDSDQQLSKSLAKIKVRPGWCIFFWNQKIDYVDHVAIIPQQDEHELNLGNAKILHSSPPPLGKGIGNSAYSGIRVSSVFEFITNSPDDYSRIILGYPPFTQEDNLKKAGQIAQEMIDNPDWSDKLIFYSFRIINKLAFVKNFSNSTKKKYKIATPYFISKKMTGSFFKWSYTYCGALVSDIYKKAEVIDIPYLKFFGKQGYTSSHLYKWFREHNTLNEAVVWHQVGKLRF